MPPTSPTLLKRQLAAELRRHREQRDLTLGAAARELGWHESKLSRIETAAVGVRKGDLERLLDLYDVQDPHRSMLIGLAIRARQRSWWEPYGEALSDAYAEYIGFEAEASAIRTYQPLVVSGLLQTAEYVNAIMFASAISDRPDLVAQRVAVRLARQAVLTREPPPHFHVILDEAVFRRPIGGPEVMRRQVLRLIEVGGRAQTVVQILPLAVGAHGGLAGSFVLLEFPNGIEAPFVYVENLAGGVIRRRPEDLSLYDQTFEVLRAMALNQAETHDFLIELSRDYE